jgi:hypothetical protein
VEWSAIFHRGDLAAVGDGGVGMRLIAYDFQRLRTALYLTSVLNCTNIGSFSS